MFTREFFRCGLTAGFAWMFSACYVPDPKSSSDNISTLSVPISGSTKYEVREFYINDWVPKKNFGFAGLDGVFLVFGGENGRLSVTDGGIFRYNSSSKLLSRQGLPEALRAPNRAFAPAIGTTSLNSGLPVFGVFGGASFVEITKTKGERSDAFTIINYNGGLLRNDKLLESGIGPRSMGCVTGYPGGDFFVYGGENLGTALDSGGIITMSGETLILPTAGAPSGRMGHACKYNPNDGLIYIFGGMSDYGVATQVYTFDRTAWRWSYIGDIPSLKNGFLYYALFDRGVVVIGEPVSGRELRAAYLSAGGVSSLSILLQEGASTVSGLPYWAGEAGGAREAGSLDSDCIILPVTGSGGLPRLKELCKNAGATLLLTDRLDGIPEAAASGVYSVPGASFNIFIGSKSVYSDPLVGGKGLILLLK